MSWPNPVLEQSPRSLALRKLVTVETTNRAFAHNGSKRMVKKAKMGLASHGNGIDGSGSSLISTHTLGLLAMALWSPLLDEQNKDDDDDEDDESSRKRCSTTTAHKQVKKMKQMIARVPRRYRVACVVLWLGWKLLSTSVLLYILWTNAHVAMRPQQHRMLHIITTTASSNATTTNVEALLSYAVESQQKLLRVDGLDVVDLYIILAGSPTVSDRERIRQIVPSSESHIWEDAQPLADSIYRQHRFVIKDQLLNYDMIAVTTDESTSFPADIARHHWEASTTSTTGRRRTEPILLMHKHHHDSSNLRTQTTTGSRSDATPMGWIATREQIFRLHNDRCSFLPPFWDVEGSSTTVVDPYVLVMWWRKSQHRFDTHSPFLLSQKTLVDWWWSAQEFAAE